VNDFNQDHFASLQTSHDNPVELALEVLLWRGFLVAREHGKLLLKVDSYQNGDSARLWKCRLSLTAHRDGEFEISQDFDHAILKKVFLLPTGNHMTGPFDYMDGQIDRDFAAFKRCRFGIKAPVERLDAGIALFIKTLPILGLQTAFSCSGSERCHPNGDNALKIGFISEHHTRWFAHLKDDVGVFGPQLRNQGSYGRVSFCHGWTLSRDEQPTDQLDLWTILQDASRNLHGEREELANEIAWEVKQETIEAESSSSQPCSKWLPILAETC